MSHPHLAAKPQLKANLDRVPFYGYRLPQEVKEMCKVLKTIDQPVFRRLLQLAVAYAERKDITYADLKVFETSQLSQEAVGVLFAGVLRTVQLALRCSESALTANGFREDLTELGIQKVFAEDLLTAVFGSRRSSIDANIAKQKPGLASLDTLHWRVDVSISTSVLSRALEPSVLLELALSDGSRRKVEVPISKFHELRYNVAFVLKEMEDIEKRSVLKIQD